MVERLTTTAPNEHNIHFILNKIPDFYIKPPLKLMDEVFESLPKLFVDIVLKKWISPLIQIVA